MENITIRPATKDDLPAIYTFVCGLEEMVFDKEQFAACYEHCISSPANHYLIAVIDDKAIGYTSCHGQILLHHCGLVYEIQEMYVDEAYRSHSIGKQLLAKLEEIIGHEQYELLEVASNMRRTDAHRFYEANGFERTTYKFKKAPIH